MDDLSPRSTSTLPTDKRLIPQAETAVPSYLATGLRQENAILRWWYLIASPSAPKSSASFKELERFRRGRTGSQIILPSICCSSLPFQPGLWISVGPIFTLSLSSLVHLQP